MVSRPIKSRDLRVFATALGAVAVLFAVLYSRRVGIISLPSLIALIGAFFLTVVAIWQPEWILPIYRPWMKFGAACGLVMTTLLLTVFYFTFLVPFTLIRTKDPLRLRKLPVRGTFWEEYKTKEFSLDRFRRPF